MPLLSKQQSRDWTDIGLRFGSESTASKTECRADCEGPYNWRDIQMSMDIGKKKHHLLGQYVPVLNVETSDLWTRDQMNRGYCNPLCCIETW